MLSHSFNSIRVFRMPWNTCEFTNSFLHGCLLLLLLLLLLFLCSISFSCFFFAVGTGEKHTNKYEIKWMAVVLVIIIIAIIIWSCGTECIVLHVLWETRHLYKHYYLIICNIHMDAEFRFTLYAWALGVCVLLPFTILYLTQNPYYVYSHSTRHSLRAKSMSFPILHRERILFNWAMDRNFRPEKQSTFSFWFFLALLGAMSAILSIYERVPDICSILAAP